MSEQINTLVIPKYEAELEALRSDLRKMILLMSQEREVTEALSAAVLQLRDRLGMPTDEPRPPSTSEGATRCDVYTELCKPQTDIKFKLECVRPMGHTEPHAYELPLWPSNLPRAAQPSEPPAGAGDVEALAAKFHEIYQQEAKRQGDVRHKDDYADLPENIKEFDRALARYVLATRATPVSTAPVDVPKCGRCGYELVIYIAEGREIKLWWCGTCKQAKKTSDEVIWATPVSTEEGRLRFETWVLATRKQTQPFGLVERTVDGYLDLYTQKQWEGWLAALAPAVAETQEGTP